LSFSDEHDMTRDKTKAPSSPLGGVLATVVRPTTPPLWLGIVVAAAFIVAETLMVYRLRQVGPESYGAVFLLGVLVISAGWEFGLAVATSLVSALVYFYFHFEGSLAPFPAQLEDFVSLLVFLPIALSANILGRQARVRAVESEQRRREADNAASLACALAEQQAALRRVATLVARGVSPAEIYPAAVSELSHGLGVQNVTLLKYAPDGAYVVAGARDDDGVPIIPKGQFLSLEGDNVAALIHRGGAPARMDSYDGAEGPTAQLTRSLGMKSAVGAPIVVDGRLWGALIAGSTNADPLTEDTEHRIGDFAYLIATAIANAETRAELTASRARIVAAADQARRRFERDLHDGAQQRVVSLGLELRGVEASVPPDQPALREQIARVSEGLTAIAADLREISRGIHPAILSRGGLGPGIKALARRSAVPVAVEVDLDCRLPEHVEVAAYYVVAEALTNAAKHAQASEVIVRANCGAGELHVEISDDGIGGAVVGAGSGLIGLKDRVDAVGGRLDIVGPPAGGTALIATIPLAETPRAD
jgi:signal transduction histidine kinase